MMLIKPQVRVYDDFGGGAYGDPRGDHKHKGNDYVCMPGSFITALKGGTVTKLGYCYSENLTFRYVEVKSSSKDIYCRYLYVEPTVKVGDWIARGDTIGHAQDVAAYHIQKDYNEQVKELDERAKSDKDRDALLGELKWPSKKHMEPHIHVETFRLVEGDRQYFDSKDYG